MKADDINKLADSVFQSVKAYCTREFAPMIERALEPLWIAIRAIPAGKDGAQGPAGERGGQGEPGRPGERGEVGPIGKDADPIAITKTVTDMVVAFLKGMPAPRDGAPGVRGEIGPMGEKGADGQIGPAGKDGAPGVDGRAGRDGVDGKDGAIGMNGKDGASGRDGKDGIDGQPGKDGAAGKDGEPGAAGKDGAPGLAGKDGAQGQRGETGQKGMDGTDGSDGRDGRDGEAGKDALQIVIQDGIDPAKGYRRGTYASWRGGTVYAFRATDPIGADGSLEKSGWQVIVNGIDSESERLLEDGRTIERSTIYTDGRRLVRTHKQAAVLYRQVWRDEKSYEPGDMVTFAGSVWHCNEQTIAKPETGSKAWTLAVKRGQPGSDRHDGGRQ